MEEEKVYGFGPFICKPDDWKRFTELANEALGLEGDKQLIAELAVEEPGFVAIEEYTREELKALYEANANVPSIWENIEPVLKLVDEGFSICFFKL